MSKAKFKVGRNSLRLANGADGTNGHISNRKAKRQANRKKAKVLKAIHYASTKNTKRVCISSSSAEYINKVLRNNSVKNSLSGKILSNDKAGGSHLNSKKKKKRKKKRCEVVPMQENVKSNGESSFKIMNKNEDRFEMLRRYVERESGTTNLVKESSTVSNLTNDEDKLHEHQSGAVREQKEFNRLANSLKMTAKQKKKFNNIFKDDFGLLIDDIEQGTMANADTYGDCKILNSDDDFEDDLNMILGKNRFEKFSKEVSKTKAVPAEGESDDEGIVSESRSSDEDMNQFTKERLNDTCQDVEADTSENDNISDVDSPDEAISGDSYDSDGGCETEEVAGGGGGFLDNEAVEASDDEAVEASDDEVSDEVCTENEEDIATSGGSTLPCVRKDFTNKKESSVFDLYESNSDGQESDLEGFVVSDNDISYETDQSDELPEEFDDGTIAFPSKESQRGKVIRRKRIRISESSVSEKEDSKHHKISHDTSRNRIVSESEDDDSVANMGISEKHDVLPSMNGFIKSEDGDGSMNSIKNTPKDIECNSLKSKKRKSNHLAPHEENEKPKSSTEKVALQSICLSKTKSSIKEKSQCDKPSTKKKKKRREKSVKNMNEKEDSILCNKSEDLMENIATTDHPTQERCGLREDIYGRLRDKDGKIVDEDASASGKKYIPPALRKLMELNSSESTKKKLDDLCRKLKGLLNRLSESNMAFVVGQIESYFQNNSRYDVNASLTKLYFAALVSPIKTSERLCQEHALVIAALSANVDIEVGAHILTEFVVKFNDRLTDFGDGDIDSKELDNLLLFIANLYNFKVVDASLLFNILSKLTDNFKDKEIELILLVLRNVGFSLRKDDPISLKNLISCVHAKALEYKVSEGEGYSRVQFLLEILTAIRNNNVSKVPGYDSSHIIHLKTLLKGIIKKDKRVTPLKVSFDDLESKVSGKWWLVGSAWTGSENKSSNSSSKISKKNRGAHLFDESSCSKVFLRKAEKLRITKYPRINIFHILMTYEDCNDTFNKLLELKLTNNHIPDIFSVIILCLLRGKVYNPFFALVATKFCHFDRKYKYKLQLSLRDKIGEIPELKATRITHLSKFLADVFAEGGLPLTTIGDEILSAASNEKLLSFIRQTLISLLLHSHGLAAIQPAFQTLLNPKFSDLRIRFRVFLIKFIKDKESGDSECMKIVAKRKETVLKMLAAADDAVL